MYTGINFFSVAHLLHNQAIKTKFFFIKLISGIIAVTAAATAIGQDRHVRPPMDSPLVLVQAEQFTRSQIRQLQSLLSDLGYDPGAADGIADDHTSAAIKAFQADQGLPPSGEITNELFSEVARLWQGKTGTLAREVPPSRQTGPDATIRREHDTTPAFAGSTGEDCTSLVSNASFAQPTSVELTPESDHVTNPSTDWLALEGMVHFSGQGEDILVHSGHAGGVFAGDGDDRIFVFDPPLAASVSGGVGSDVIHVCSLAAAWNPMTFASMTTTIDTDPDTLVVHPGAFVAAAAMGRTEFPDNPDMGPIDGAEIIVMPFDARTDRIVLRPPEPMTPKIVRQGYGQAVIQVGPIRLSLMSFDPDAPDPMGVISVESAAPGEADADAAVARRMAEIGAAFSFADGETADRHNGNWTIPDDAVRPDDPASFAATARCADIGEYTMFDPPLEDSGPQARDTDFVQWSSDDDMILHRGMGVQHWVMAGDGDDQIWLDDLDPNSAVNAGHGADLIVLCSMADMSAYITLSYDIDVDPDTLIIGPSLLRDVPEGYTRRITVVGFQPEYDRLILPPGPTPVIELWGGAAEGPLTGVGLTVTQGPIEIMLGHKTTGKVETARNAIQVGGLPVQPHLEDIARRKTDMIAHAAAAQSFAAESWASARTVGGGPVPGSAPTLACGDAEGVDNVARLPETATSDVHLSYGDGDDTIVLRARREDPDHGIARGDEVLAGAGDDTVYALTADAGIIAGPGTNTVLLCGSDGLWATVQSDVDGQPDTVVVDASVFSTPVPEGLYRRLSFELGDPGDRLVLRLPEDAQVRADDGYPMFVETPAGATRIGLGLHPAPGAASLENDPNRIILWPVSGAPAGATQPSKSTWTYSSAGGLTGSASIQGSNGSVLTVNCGNSGEVGVAVSPDISPRPTPGYSEAIIGFVIDGREANRFNIPMICQNDRCDSGGRPGVLPLVRALQAGSSVQISWEDRDLAVYSLYGSAETIAEIEAAGCPGF